MRPNGKTSPNMAKTPSQVAHVHLSGDGNPPFIFYFLFFISPAAAASNQPAAAAHAPSPQARSTCRPDPHPHPNPKPIGERIESFHFILFRFVLGTRLILRPIDFFVEFQFQVRRLRGALPGSALRSGSALACSPLCALWRPPWRPLWSCWPGISLYGAAGAARWLFWYYFSIIK